VVSTLAVALTLLVSRVPEPEPDAVGPSVSVEEIDAGLDRGPAGAATPVPAPAPADGAASPSPADGDPSPAAGVTSPADGAAQADLVEGEDERLFAAVARIEPGTAPSEVPSAPGRPGTVVLPARVAPYDLPALVGVGAVVAQPDGGYLVQRNVLVGPGAQLRISAPGTTLRMLSAPEGFTSLVGFRATVALEGADGRPLTLTSWDPARGAADTEPRDGRAYLRAIGGRLDLAQVRATDLGFWSGRTGGVAWTGSATEVSTGSARDCAFVGNHYGVFTTRSTGLLINGGEVRGSAMDGIAVHKESEGTQVWRVTTTRNAGNGIAVSKGARQVSVREVTATGNLRNGVYLDGSPQAGGPNASGASAAAGGGFVVDGSTVSGNAEHGILVARARGAELTRNTVSANRDGVVVRGTADQVTLRENRISSPGGFGVAVRDGARGAVIARNTITDAVTAVQVDDAVASVSGNEIDRVAAHAVSVKGASDGSEVLENRLAGRGPSAVDLARLATGAGVTVAGNDVRGFDVDRDDVRYLAAFVGNHPLILVWVLILLLPLATRVYLARRRPDSRAADGSDPGEPPSGPARPDAGGPSPERLRSATRVTVVSE
jgi:nitrous oxidase accessory protein NosD